MWLLTANDTYTIEELADMLDTSPRTIYRYLDTFKAAGFSVRKHKDHYSLTKESKYFEEISQLVHFTDEEALIFNKLLDGLDNSNLLKQNLKRKLASVYNFSGMADIVAKGKDSSNIHQLIMGIEEKRICILKNYSSSHTRITRDRRVEPFSFTTNYVGIWCYDLDDNCCKIFKTSRIEDVEVTTKEWLHEEEHKEAPMDIFRMTGQLKWDLKLELGMTAHNLILEEYPLSEKYITRINSRKWRLETKVSSLVGVGRFYLGLADDIKIISPKELKDYIKVFVTDNLLTVLQK